MADVREKVNYGLLGRIIDLFDVYGIRWADDDPDRRERALETLADLAEVVAGPAR